jgi:hypothetical protein
MASYLLGNDMSVVESDRDLPNPSVLYFSHSELVLGNYLTLTREEQG